MRVGILGAGGIAGVMADTIRGLEGVENYAIASRDLAKARAFARKWGFQKAYGSYEEMLKDDGVDLVYIALPHSLHYAWTLAALNAGRHVLCEKAFAVNARQAEEMTALSESRGLLLAEAIWTRYMPSRKILSDLISSDEIGEIMTVSSNLGYAIDMNERMVSPALAGGCLLDLTVYTLNFSSMVLGDAIKTISASMVATPTGVDGQNTVMLEYANGKMASMFTTMYTVTAFVEKHRKFPELPLRLGKLSYQFSPFRSAQLPGQMNATASTGTTGLLRHPIKSSRQLHLGLPVSLQDR